MPLTAAALMKAPPRRAAISPVVFPLAGAIEPPSAASLAESKVPLEERKLGAVGFYRDNTAMEEEALDAALGAGLDPLEDAFDAVERTVEDAMVGLLGPEAAGKGQCFINTHGVRMGCKVKCRCALWQTCFPHHVMWKDFEDPDSKDLLQLDVGACHLSMGLLVILSVLLLIFTICLIVLGRMILTWVDDKNTEQERFSEFKGPGPLDVSSDMMASAMQSVQSNRVGSDPGAAY